jgi:hypothetical protein
MKSGHLVPNGKVAHGGTEFLTRSFRCQPDIFGENKKAADEFVSG